MPGPNAFPREERLTRRRDYLAVYRNGDKITGNAFICYQVRQPHQGRKLGMAVTRKAGSAVVRNRIKRYIREIYRTGRKDMRDDVQIVVVARPSSARLDFHASAAELRRLFARGDVYRA